MLERVQLENLDDYFTDLGKRKVRGVYFYRFNGYNSQIDRFIRKYYEAARINGVIIEGKLQNPDNNNLAYYNEMMGMEFQLDLKFIDESLKKWLPRMTDDQRKNVAYSFYETLTGLEKSGKNINMLKNAYIKFMCWLYYKFERITDHLGEEKVPKILYEGNIGNYELLFMNVLALTGCDIVLLQYNGDGEYLRTDPGSSLSYEFKSPEMTGFPKQFNLRQIQKDRQQQLEQERLYGVRPQIENCTNAWISGKILEDVKESPVLRGNDRHFFYNCFCRITGVEDRFTYENELYQLQLEIRKNNRKIVIVNHGIKPPTVEEINNIRRENYQNINQLIMSLSSNIQCTVSQELQRLMIKAFVDLILQEGKKENTNLNRVTNKAVYLLCWLKRYQQQLFQNWKESDIACFFYMGECKNDSEALFCRFLGRLPVDVLIFNPDLDQKCCIEDPLLYEIHYENSLSVDKYPEENGGIQVATSAYRAERDLDHLMYQDSGMYRNHQYEKANTISLRTMYEEIAILWDQEMKYRPNFSTVGDIVNMPVIFAKVSGVKDGVLPAYWSSIKKLITEDTIVIKTVPYITSVSENPLKAHATEFFRNGKLQKTKIKNHRAYQYGFLRESMQDYLLDKIQLLIDQKIIKGTFENGTEYTIVSIALNLEKNVLRMIQKFDFTKKNPKLIYIITGETALSLEDTIYTAFLNLIGFDIVFFVPTGYQCVERYFRHNMIEEHQIGEYLYDLQAPDFNTVSVNENTRHSWRELIFKRGI